MESGSVLKKLTEKNGSNELFGVRRAIKRIVLRVNSIHSVTYVLAFIKTVHCKHLHTICNSTMWRVFVFFLTLGSAV